MATQPVRLDPYQNIVAVGWPDSEWKFTLNGFLFNERGWTFEDDAGARAYKLRIDFQDSLNCGGENDFVQSGTAVRRFRFLDRVGLTVDLIGSAELESVGFERITIRINDTPVIEAESAGGGQGCTMGDPVINPRVPFPIIIEAGSVVVVEVITSTNDNLFHTDAFYEMLFRFDAV